MSDDIGGLDPEMRALLGEVGGPEAPPGGAKDRVGLRLSAALGIPLVDGFTPGGEGGADPSGGAPGDGGAAPDGASFDGADGAGLDGIDVGGGLDAGDGLGIDPSQLIDAVQASLDGGVQVASGLAGTASGAAKVATGLASTAGKVGAGAAGSAAAGAASSGAAAGGAVAASAATSAATVGATSAGLAAVVAKPLVIGSFVVGAVLGGGTIAVVKPKPPVVAKDKPRVVYVPTPPRTPEEPVPAPAADLGVQTAPEAVVEAAPEPKPTVRKKRPRIAARATPPPPPVEAPEPSVLAEERAMLETARGYLTRGKHKNALKALDQHRDRFREGKLAEEREALTVLALVALGQDAEAEAAARAFRRAYPGSMQLPVIEAALGARSGLSE